MIIRIALPLILLLALAAFALHPAVGQEPVSKPRLRIPDYYIGQWTAAATRAGDISYFFRCDGTGEARYNQGRKEKFQDITYRVLSTSAEQIVLFVKKVDTEAHCALTCGKKGEKCIGLCGQAYYTYWTLSPSNSYGSEFKMMRIVDHFHVPFENVEDPFELSDQFLRNKSYNLDTASTSAYHFKSSLPCLDK